MYQGHVDRGCECIRDHGVKRSVTSCALKNCGLISAQAGSAEQVQALQGVEIPAESGPAFVSRQRPRPGTDWAPPSKQLCLTQRPNAGGETFSG